MIIDSSLNKIKMYDWVLFDADETLFHFDAFGGLKLMLSQFNVDFTLQNYEEYQKGNKVLWTEYQNGKITARDVKNRRFDSWAAFLKVSAEELNSRFLQTVADLCAPIEGAVSLLHALKGKAKLGIITNGFTELQHIRLERTGLRDFFEVLVISEEVGFAKPDRRIFDHALAMMGNPERSRVLIVGDTAESDIRGGIDSGLDTCWFNASRKDIPDGIIPHYQVFSLKELEDLLVGEKAPRIVS